ncbi:MAG: protoporphyrinogen oxidase [Thermomicrobiales bacterium]|nr:protoporphyrinogen oxidase [Thermomicrobiales bacterium]
MATVGVIGAGIAGLSAAWTLRKRGIDVRVLEASDRLGGKIRTEHADGLLIDAGPDSFLSSKPPGLALVSDLGLTDQVISTLPDGGGTFILHNGKLEALPEGMTLLVPADPRAIMSTPLLSPIGKVRLLGDYVIPRSRNDEDESVSSFMRRRVGREAFEHLAEPLLSGIFAGDADQLSILATYPRLRATEREHGGLIRGAMAMRKQMTGTAPTRPYTPFVSLQGGLGQIIDGLADAIGRERIAMQTPVCAIRTAHRGYVVTTDAGEEQFDALILAIPAPAAATLLAEIDPELSSLTGTIPYISSATISLAFNAAEVAGQQRGRGFVIPRREGRTLTAVTWTSNKFGGRVPEGQALLRGFVGRAGDEAPALLPDDELIPIIRRELADILGITASPTTVRIFRWPKAMPQYTVGHLDRLRSMEHRLATLPGLRLAGAAYRGVGIPDCIADATAQATTIADWLAPNATEAQSAERPTISA